MRTAATLALLVVGASLSVAQSPTGAWKGKLKIQFPPIPANAPAEQKAQFAKMKANLDKAVFNLTLNGNKTWKIKATGVPMGPNGDSQEGTWTQTGKKITLKAKPSAKNPNFTPPPQDAVLSADGKTLTITIPQGRGSLVFKR
ncbi:MAG: hypothetical protein ACO1SV_17510 [Fimbriimonas sp.]